MFLIDRELKLKNSSIKWSLIIKKVWNKGILIINHKTLIMKVVSELFSITPWFVAALD